MKYSMINAIYQTAEILATVIEALIVLFVAGTMSKYKYSGKKHLLIFLTATVLYTVLISIMNKWEPFSFATILTAIVFTIIYVLLFCSANILCKITSVILTFFFIHAVDFSISYSLIMIIGKSFDISKGIPLIINPGPTRLLFLAIVKGLQILIFFSCRKIYKNLSLLSNKAMWLLLIITTLSYIIMSLLMQLILTESLVTIQIAIIFSQFFIMLSIIGAIFAISVNSKFQNEKREKQLMALTNKMIEKNYTVMRNTQNEVRRQVHDFKNHLRTIDGMITESSPAKEYVEDLLAESYNSAQFCRSGNDIIDSIINCKIPEAKQKNISFSFSVNLNSKLNISSVDICAVLANQIDNALEAATKTEDLSKRFVKVETYQKESFVFFKVENSCKDNPFNKKHELKTTKDNSNGMHGLGVKNIRETTEKYGGKLKNEYNDGVFTSVAMLINNV